MCCLRLFRTTFRGRMIMIKHLELKALLLQLAMVDQCFVRPTYVTNSDLSKNIVNISNSYYGKEEKYSDNEDDNFKLKFKLFKEPCDQNSVEGMDRPKAFLIMLIGRARQSYFDNFHGKWVTIADLFNGVRERFLTIEHVRSLLREWDSINFNAVMSMNPDKKRWECLNILVSWLQDIQSGLTNKYQTRLCSRTNSSAPPRM